MKLYFIAPIIVQKIIWLPTRLVLKFFGHLNIKGLENLDGIKGPVIFACNHSSAMDEFMVPASLPFFSRFSPLFYPVREKEFYKEYGWKRHFFDHRIMNLWGSYAVITGMKDYEKSLHKHIKILKDGGSFCYFPEGGITMDGNFQPAKGGVAYLAEKNLCAIIPVRIDGVFRVSIKEFFSFKRQISVTFGQVITFGELENISLDNSEPDIQNYKIRSTYVMKKIADLH